MKIQCMGVIGAGQMGGGIAQVAAASGLKVILHDIKDEFVGRGISAIERNLARQVDKGRLEAAQKDNVMARIKPTTHLSEMAGIDFAVEAATENEAIKLQIFRDLDAICPSLAILATNTSSIPIGRIAAVTKRPDKVIGMHFMNPVPVMQLVEIIRALTTSNETFQATWALSETFGKKPACAEDYPGFIANRILMPMINEAVFCLYHRICTAEDIDKVMKLGMNHPMGPLALADLIGLDTCLAIMQTLFDGFKDSKYRPCPLLQRYVECGWLGRKSGKGFYSYS